MFLVEEHTYNYHFTVLDKGCPDRLYLNSLGRIIRVIVPTDKSMIPCQPQPQPTAISTYSNLNLQQPEPISTSVAYEPKPQ